MYLYHIKESFYFAHLNHTTEKILHINNKIIILKWKHTRQYFTNAMITWTDSMLIYFLSESILYIINYYNILTSYLSINKKSFLKLDVSCIIKSISKNVSV